MIQTWPSILITDDDEALREVLGTLFAPRGFHVFLADDGENALKIVRRNRIDVVLMDMHMPRLTGLEAIRQVKQYRAELPCILMSANADEKLVREAQQANAYAVLRKPVSSGQVSQAVHDALMRTYDWMGGGPQYYV